VREWIREACAPVVLDAAGMHATIEPVRATIEERMLVLARAG
jgi:hypothetical protein